MRKLIFLVLMLVTTATIAQDAAIAKYKAMFTLNFIRYIGWPDAAKQGDFVIGIVNDHNILNNMQAQTVGKKFGFQNIVVKEFKKVEDITDCQILFFSNNQNYNKYAEEVKSKLGNKNSLIVTEREGATKSGSMINFVIRDGKLKFELSSVNANKFNLKFSSSLTSLSNAIVKD